MPSGPGVLEFSRSLRAAINHSVSDFEMIAAECNMSPERLEQLANLMRDPNVNLLPSQDEILHIYCCIRLELRKEAGELYELDDLILLVYSG